MNVELITFQQYSFDSSYLLLSLLFTADLIQVKGAERSLQAFSMLHGRHGKVVNFELEYCSTTPKSVHFYF